MARKEYFQTTNPPHIGRDFAVENDELRARLRVLTQAAEKNALIFKKVQERELELLQAESLPALLNILVDNFTQSYLLDSATLILHDPHHEIRHLLLADGRRLEDFSKVMLVDQLYDFVPSFGAELQPCVGPYVQTEHRKLFPRDRLLKSVAIIPLRRQQKVIGALNFGSSDPERFTREHATDFLGYLGIIAAVCLENAVNHARLLRSGITDFLTGAHNRRYLHVRLKEELARAQRQRSSVACLMIDVDYFKPINDSLGHLAGDEMLRSMVERVVTQIRASDTIARFGGDEFAVLLPATALTEATQLAERLHKFVCSTPVDLGEGRFQPLSLSIGVAAIQPNNDHRNLNAAAESLLAAADNALYRAKFEGRGRVAAMEEPALTGAGEKDEHGTATQSTAGLDRPPPRG